MNRKWCRRKYLKENHKYTFQKKCTLLKLVILHLPDTWLQLAMLHLWNLNISIFDSILVFKVSLRYTAYFSLKPDKLFFNWIIQYIYIQCNYWYGWSTILLLAFFLCSLFFVYLISLSCQEQCMHSILVHSHFQIIPNSFKYNSFTLKIRLVPQLLLLLLLFNNVQFLLGYLSRLIFPASSFALIHHIARSF